ncbi:phospholipase D family protein [Chloroflexota bacterium]
MAKFLDTAGITFYLQQIINNANERLILISPYLKINDRIKSSLVDKDKFKIDIRLIYGKSELQPEERNWLNRLQYVRTSFCKDLHAKCYLNEKEVIVTSMNLYDFSQVNNYEMGIYIKKDEDTPLYDEIYQEVSRLIRTSGDEITVTVSKTPSTRVQRPKSTQADNGYCIRCHTEIKLNPMIPYCRKCYGSWNEYKNDEFEEKCCHICGKQNKSTKLKPSCYGCYTKYKDKLEFPVLK